MRRAHSFSAPTPTVVGRYALTEVLAVGERANVFAAVALGAAAAAHADSPVVVKIRLGGPVTAVRHARFETAGHVAELEALSARPIAAMPRLVDAVRDEEGRAALVLARCEGRPLGEVVRASACDESSLRAIGLAVRRLHDAGWAHGGLDPGAVLVGADAAVTLVGFGRAVPRGAPGFDDAIAADLRWVAGVERAGVRGGEGVSVSAGGRVTAPAEGWRWSEARDPGESAASDVPRIAETVDPALAAVGELLRAVRATPGAWARCLTRRALAMLGLAAAVLIVVVGAILLLPGGEGAGGERSGDTGTGDARAGGERPGGARAEGEIAAPVEDAPAGPSDAPTVGDVGRSGGASSGPGPESAVLGDDPVAATVELLRLRETCFAAADATCLDGVDQWGSPAWTADLEEIGSASGERRELPAGAGADADVSTRADGVRLVQRVGDFALVEVNGAGRETTAAEAGAAAGTTAAPLLVVRGGAGWRVRSYGPEGP